MATILQGNIVIRSRVAGTSAPAVLNVRSSNSLPDIRIMPSFPPGPSKKESHCAPQAQPCALLGRVLPGEIVVCSSSGYLLLLCQ